ncbi:ketopantoate reductase family protein [Variovorax sp. KK3]|uniref:ketopantoate reductase family protein n=1 Tax=Variovorax sp. KK3 TaxID=1855728 RepID=UPI00097BD034|nr:2-dehydropantoate 2-reductase [Variovorax sp. KK3]
MRITLVGPGAIGGAIASRLLRGGVELSLLASPRGAAVLRREGLRVREGGVLYHDHPPVAEDASELGPQDLVILCLKGHALAEGARSLAPLVGPQTLVVAAQNGIPWWFFEGFGGALAGRRLQSVDPHGEIARNLPASQCVGCMIYIAAYTDDEGVIHAGGHSRLVLGEAVDAGGQALARAVAVLERSGLEIRQSDQIRREVWLKLWGNLTVNPLSALTGATIDRMVADPLVSQLIGRMMDEARSLTDALGIDLGMRTEERIAGMRALGPVKTSMLQDMEAGRAPEIGAIIGAVAEIGDLLDIDTPFIDAVLGMVRQRAASAGH